MEHSSCREAQAESCRSNLDHVLNMRETLFPLLSNFDSDYTFGGNKADSRKHGGCIFGVDTAKTKISEEEHKELHDFRKLAEKKVNQLFSAIVEQRNAKSLEKVLEGTVAKDADVGEGSTMCLWYDSKCAGEASSQPHCRVPKFRQNHFRTFLHATLGGRKLPQLDQKMLVCLSDGFSPSLGNSATTAFVLEDGTSVPKNRILFHNIYDAASLSARKTVVRGVIQNVEGLHVPPRRRRRQWQREAVPTTQFLWSLSRISAIIRRFPL